MIIVKDTREKTGYTFANQVDETLATGDYSIKGLEDKLCIERKASTTEIAINLGSDKTRFMAEIERMKLIPHRFIVLEFSMDDLMVFPDRTDIPKWRKKSIRVTPQYMLRVLTEIQVHHEIPILFCGTKELARTMVETIMRRVNEIYNG